MICFFSVSICVVYIAVFVNYYVKLIKFVHVNSLDRDAIGLDFIYLYYLCVFIFFFCFSYGCDV